MKILVTGAQGMVGQGIQTKFSKYNLLLTARKIPTRRRNRLWKSLDITDKRQVKKILEDFKPNIIIHLAALTNLEFCQKFPRAAFVVNGLGTKFLAEQAKILRADFAYISTANVFPGKKKFYTENDRPGSLNTYGRSKLEGEKYIKKILKKYYIVRAGWMIGVDPKKDKKFVGLIANQLKQGKKEISVVNDKFGTLTFAQNLASNLKKLIEYKMYGTYHLSCEKPISRYDIADEMVKYSKSKVKLTPVSSTFFKHSFFVPRPKYECLKSIKDNFIKIRTLPKWRIMLRKYLDKF